MADVMELEKQISQQRAHPIFPLSPNCSGAFSSGQLLLWFKHSGFQPFRVLLRLGVLCCRKRLLGRPCRQKFAREGPIVRKVDDSNLAIDGCTNSGSR